MPLQPLEAVRLYERIANQIADLIRAREFELGDRLPPERVLAHQLGVSRPSVREAMIALEVAGLVEVRNGTGTYVRSMPQVGAGLPILPRSDGGPGPFEWIQARMLVEGEVAALAARAISTEALNSLRDSIVLMERENADSGTTEAGDREFHLGIAQASNNSVLASIVEALWDQMRGPLWNQVNRLGLTPEYRAQWVRDHHAVLNSLAQRNARRGRATMHQHLTHVKRALLGP